MEVVKSNEKMERAVALRQSLGETPDADAEEDAESRSALLLMVSSWISRFFPLVPSYRLVSNNNNNIARSIPLRPCRCICPNGIPSLPPSTN